MYTHCSAVSCVVWLCQLCGVICSWLSSDPVHSRKIAWYLFSRDVRSQRVGVSCHSEGADELNPAGQFLRLE